MYKTWLREAGVKQLEGGVKTAYLNTGKKQENVNVPNYNSKVLHKVCVGSLGGKSRLNFSNILHTIKMPR